MAGHRGKRPAEGKRPIDWVLLPFQAFARAEAASGILLLACTAAALAWANSPWQQTYHDFWHTYLSIGAGDYTLKMSLQHWVNDALMAIFFFVVGLEIKREVLVGELASLRKAAVPIAAAVGGMAVPALLYAAVNWGRPTLDGWAIPAATDIAFAIGVLALLGKRVPTSLKVFLTALAIVDDIGAVLIIAMFYSGELDMPALSFAGVITGILIVGNLLHVRARAFYAILGVGLWLAVFHSGIHATIAGVVLALTIPARCRITETTFVSFARSAVEEFARSTQGQQGGRRGAAILSNPSGQAAVHALESACESIQAPLVRLEHSLHPLVAYFVMPIFALANAGISLGGNLLDAFRHPVTLGIILGLVIGKQVGVTTFSWLAVRFQLGDMPARTTWAQVYGAGWLAGIGFTMSLFIAGLAFPENPELLETAKIGIIAASLVSGVVGFLLLRSAGPASAARE